MPVHDRMRWEPAVAGAMALAAMGAAVLTTSLAVPAPLQGQKAPVALSLRQAVAVAMDSAPAVSLAGLRTEEARGRWTDARSVYFPSLNGTASYLRQSMNRAAFGIEFPTLPGGQGLPDRIGPFDVWDARGEVSQTLFSPAGWVRVRAARREVEASTSETGAAAQTAAARAAASYVTALEAEATLAARRRELGLAMELLDVAEQQRAAGVGTRLDEVRARSRVASARGAIEVATTQVSRARIDLARSLGYPPGAEIALTDTLSADLGRSAAPSDRDEAVATALGRRPELEVLRARISAATAGARAVTAERLGALQLVGDYGVNGPEPSRAITTGRLSLRYSVPIFDGPSLTGRRAAAEARIGEARLQLEDLGETIVGEVEEALAAVRSGEARREIASDQLTLAEEELSEARLLYARGVAGNIAVINAQTDLVNADNAVIGALAQTAQARIQLARAVGAAGSIR